MSSGVYERWVRTKNDGRTSLPEYLTWQRMKKRCKWAENWAGRGIVVCEDWVKDFWAFYHHVGPMPSLKHSLDRIDNNGNYEPGNVRWATRSEQMKNRRPYSPGAIERFRQGSVGNTNKRGKYKIPGQPSHTTVWKQKKFSYTNAKDKN